MPSYTFLHDVPMQALQSYLPTVSSDSSLPQTTGPLDLNGSLFYRWVGPGGLCQKEMMMVDWSYEMGVGA
jgi:hypothetical protein